ncbi:hypothetical protein ACET3X_008062 [Alternaria dauci]|uniref:Uncharacterized protein n=1 Tax=Alternaria dauci TaxID=48095 RepID=A0ABR3U9B8_9PLEO
MRRQMLYIGLPMSRRDTSSCSEITPIETKQGFDGKSFAAGLLPGIVIGALSTLGLIWILNKRREHQSKERYSGDFGHVARQISDPIYDPQLAARTDFMRRGSHSAYSSPNSTDRIAKGIKETNTNPPIHGFTPRIKSMWDRTPKLNFGFTSGLPSNPAPPVRAGNPYTNPYQTPPPKPKRIHSASRRTSSLRTSDQTFNTLRTGQHRSSGERSGSSETIDVLMPTPSFLAPPQAPGMQRDNRYTTDSANTTFTRLMERAGFDESALQEVKDWRTPKV